MKNKPVFYLGNRVQISPAVWPDKVLKVQPGDLTQFAPQGNSVYGYQLPFRTTNPFLSAPEQEASGGVLYFGNDITKEDLMSLARITGIQSAQDVNPDTRYAVFTTEAKQPGEEGYLAQARVIPRFALQHMYGVLDDDTYHSFPKQEMTIIDLFWHFIETEKKRWGTSFVQDSQGLGGLFGGDGDFAREELCFGIMIENSYSEIYRIWSRAWLVTK